MALKNQDIIAQKLSEHLKDKQSISLVNTVSGGSINSTYTFGFGPHYFFLKENSKKEFPEMFSKEAKGLEELSQCRALRVPKPILVIETETEQYLVIEYLEKTASTSGFFEKLGAGLAELHKIKNKTFGFSEDNYIGSVVQTNSFSSSWGEFFSERRLSPLVKWCYDEKLIGKLHLNSFENLYKKLDSIFPAEEPSLIHGDLWSGNMMNTTSGPAIYDPAVYYGHREMDIAMSRLFGGFDPAFYESYNAHYPLEKSHARRTEICNLYPLLVHVKLFGTSYLHDVLSVIKQF